MNGYWNYIPLFRYLVPFVTGILISVHWHLHHPAIVYIFLVLAAAYCITQSFTFFSASFRWQSLYGILLHLVLLSGGMFLTQADTPLFQDNYFLQENTKDAVFTCRITRPPEFTEKTQRLYVQVISRCDSTGTMNVAGRSILYIKKKDNDSLRFNYGDIIYIPDKFSEPAGPKNPGEFDYRTFLYNRKIYHTAFLNANEIVPAGINNSKWIWRVLFGCKAYFIRLMEENIKDDDARTVGEALIIGQNGFIADNVQQAYANTGTMHILAVSGLHVGILFVILEFLFKPLTFLMRKRSSALLVKTIIILVIIWLYACLSGLSPSVNRSAVMFTFLALGKMYDRRIDSFNILFVSMIPLLLDDPYQITQVGFQLSYLAVGGIIFFQPLVQALWKPKFAVLKYIWSMSAVSIAAQIATSPVSIYFFHQFPNYFLLSNLIAIPVSFIILILGVAFFIMGSIPLIGKGIAFCLEKCLMLMNNSVISVERLPHSLTDSLLLTGPETFLWYGVILFAGAFLILKNKLYFNCGLFCLLMITVSFAGRKITQHQSCSVTFYSLKGHSAILIDAGKDGIVLTDFDSLADSEDFTFHIEGDLITKGIKSPEIINYKKAAISDSDFMVYLDYPFFFFKQHTFFFLDDSTKQMRVTDPAAVDYIIIRDNPFLKIDSTFYWSHATILIDGSNSRRRNNFYQSAFQKQGIACYSMISNGAVVIQ